MLTNLKNRLMQRSCYSFIGIIGPWTGNGVSVRTAVAQARAKIKDD